MTKHMIDEIVSRKLTRGQICGSQNRLSNVNKLRNKSHCIDLSGYLSEELFIRLNL